jgi:hypothetical protein
MRGTMILGAVAARRDMEYMDLMARHIGHTTRLLMPGIVRDWTQSDEAKIHMAAVSTGMRFVPRDYSKTLFL